MNINKKVLLAAFCGCLTAASVMAQTTYVWTNQFPTHPAGGDLGVAANWNPNGLANPANGDMLEWNESTTNNLVLGLQGGFNGSSGQLGINLYMSPAQTNSLQIIPSQASAGTPRMNSVFIDSGAGQFSLGDNTLNTLEIVWGSAFTQGFTNNSPSAAIVYPNIKWRMGGGGTHTFDFAGTGDWIVNNYVRNDNSAGSAVKMDGTGTLYWYGTNVPNASEAGVPVNGGLTVDSGTVVLETFDILAPSGTGNISIDPMAVGNTWLKYNAPLTNTALTVGGAGTISALIIGSGPLEVDAGSLTLSGANTYSGTNFLVGGELIADHAENPGNSGPLGTGAVITFRGGTLGFSAANTYDYSSRFDTANNQLYSVDVPSSLGVQFATGLTSIGGSLNKIGGGTLTLSGANTYSGTTTVSGGTLALQGSMGTGAINVADGQSLSVVENGITLTPSSVSLGTTTSANVIFNNVTNLTTAPIVSTGAINAAGPINITVTSGSFKNIGQVFPLLTWANGQVPPAVNNPPTVTGALGTLSTNGNSIVLTIGFTPYIWTGVGSTWDTTTTGDWLQSGSGVVWQNNVLTLFDDSAASGAVNVAAQLQPGAITVNNNTLPYTITSSGANAIGGTNGLTKSGSTNLTLIGGTNSYTGATTITGGLLSVGSLANGGVDSDIGAATSAAANLVLNGGTLQYTGPGATIDRQFTLGPNGGTIDGSGTSNLVLGATGPLTLGGGGLHALALTGVSSNTLAANITDAAGNATSVTISGSGVWTLTGTNTYSGQTLVQSGELQIGGGAGSGTIGSGSVVNHGVLDFFSTNTVTVLGAVSGGGSLTNDGPGTTILANNNNITGQATINAGTLQVGTGGSSGSLLGTVVDDGTFVWDSTTAAFTLNGITGTGNLKVAAGTYKNVGNNTYTGWTVINSGAIFTPTDNNTGNAGILSTSVITNNGTLRLEGYTTRTPLYANIVGTGKVQAGSTGASFDQGDQVLAGTNTYSGGTFIGGNHLVFGDGVTPNAGSFVGNITFVNNFEDSQDNIRRVKFNRPDVFTVPGNITTNFNPAQVNQGIVEMDGPGTCILTGNNTYASGTDITNGTVQVGNGGATGTLGFGTVTDNAALAFDLSSTYNLTQHITGSGTVLQMGTGTVILTNTANNYTGATTISNGVLVIGPNVGGDLDVYGGELVSGVILGDAQTNTIAGNMNIGGGLIQVNINGSSNTTFVVGGTVTATGGSLKLIDAGAPLIPGTVYQIFSSGVVGGNTLTILTPGYTVENDLVSSGSVKITAVVPPTSDVITPSISAGRFLMSWPASFEGLHLQYEIRALTNGIAAGTNWIAIPGTDASNSYSATLTNQSMFFRLEP